MLSKQQEENAVKHVTELPYQGKVIRSVIIKKGKVIRSVDYCSADTIQN